MRTRIAKRKYDMNAIGALSLSTDTMIGCHRTFVRWDLVGQNDVHIILDGESIHDYDTHA